MRINLSNPAEPDPQYPQPIFVDTHNKITRFWSKILNKLAVEFEEEYNLPHFSDRDRFKEWLLEQYEVELIVNDGGSICEIEVSDRAITLLTLKI